MNQNASWLEDEPVEKKVRDIEYLMPSMTPSALRIRMQKGSVTFYLASRLFPKKERSKIEEMYNFFRILDDIVDETKGESATLMLDSLMAQIESAEKHHSDASLKKRHGSSEKESSSNWGAGYEKSSAALLSLIDDDVPLINIREFLQGMRSDIAFEAIKNEDELLKYCYRVAGVVGVIFCRTMGIADAERLQRASHLGIAMQLTNIARDIQEDRENCRRYLPRSWFDEKNIPLDRDGFWDEANPRHRQKVASLVSRLIKIAERYYQSGFTGIAQLPLILQPAIYAAAVWYREIGVLLKENGGNYRHGRTVVSPVRKMSSLIRSFREQNMTDESRSLINEHRVRVESSFNRDFKKEIGHADFSFSQFQAL